MDIKEQANELARDIYWNGICEEFHQKRHEYYMYDYHKARRLELQAKYNELIK